MNATKMQTAVRDFIVARLAAGHPCPSRREIAEHFGFASHNAASCHIEALVRKGLLVRDPVRARSLRLPANTVRPTAARPTTGRTNAARFSAGRPTAAQRSRTVEVPIFGSIPAGFGEFREGDAEGCIAVDVDALQIRPTARTFALRVSGDSMTGCGILDGDLVLLEHGVEPRPGQVVAALIDGKSTLKRFIVKGSRAYLKAENPQYPDLIPAEELMVQGVLRALIRKAE